MKKLLVLSLVLAVAGLANAGLITTNLANGLDAVVDNTAKTISFVATGSAAGVANSITALGLNIQLNAEGTVAFVSGVTTTSDGFGPWLGNDWAGYAMMDTNGKVGTIAVFSYTGDATVATLYNDDTFGTSLAGFRSQADADLGGAQITLVPEPMTMGLLGLGALFLRKRK